MENQQGQNEEEWEVNSVLRTVARGKSIVRPLQDKLSMVMLTLETDKELEHRIRNESPRMDTIQILQSILEDWKSREAENATISALINALKECKLYRIAKIIDKQHGAQHLQNTKADGSLKLKTLQSPAIHKTANDVVKNYKPEPETIPLCEGAEMVNDEVRDEEGNNVDNCVLNVVKSKVGRWILMGGGAVILLTIVLIVIFTVGSSRSNSYSVATTLVPQNEQNVAAHKTIVSQNAQNAVAPKSTVTQNVQNVASNASIVPQNVQKVAAPTIIVIVPQNVQQGASNTTLVPKIAPKVAVTKKNSTKEQKKVLFS